MATYKFIYWRDDLPKQNGMRFANIHYLVGYNARRIKDYQDMVAQLQKTFPQAKADEIECGYVTKSHFCQAFTLIMWSAHIPEGDYPGWSQAFKSPDYSY